MGLTAEQMEKMIESELGTQPGEQKLTARQRSTEVEALKRELEWLGERTGEVKEGLVEERGIAELPAEEKTDAEVREQYEAQRQKAPTGEEVGKEAVMFGLPGKQLDIYEQMKWQVYGLEKGLVPSARAKEAEEAEEAGEAEEVKRAAERAGGATEERPRRTMDYAWRELSDAEMEARAKTILGPHETFASYSNDKFNRHLRAAEEYLKQGKYYRAADAYTLASMYKPGDPLADAGKSHALFAAGEYMSSALYLARALEIFPDYARFKIDIVAMVGDRDRLETRIADVEQWWKTSNSPELQFLLAYVYYQMDRVERAREAINNAHENMPEAAAIITLKRAIETRGRR
jgi:tetratricopeptide (TPR) repeat protein